MARVYVSLPLDGPVRAAGREVLRGAQLAAERAGLELIVADTSGDWTARDPLAAAHARAAVADPRALAYVGDFHSSQVASSAPLLSAAGVLQVAPVATLHVLEGATLVLLTPDDAALARDIGGWVAAAGVRRLLVVHDHDGDYGVPVGELCAQAARARGLDVRARPVWDEDEAMAADLDGAQAVLYAGVAGSGAVGLWDGLYALDRGLWLLGTDGVARPELAAGMGEGAAARTRFFAGQRAPWGFYGHEAVALIADAIARAGEADRAAVAAAARATRERDSVLGRYSIDDRGRATGLPCGVLAVAGGELVWQ
jgi:branched-chain amino acid transport system substrate-binding protein